MMMKILNFEIILLNIFYFLNYSYTQQLFLEMIRENEYNIFGYLVFTHEDDYSYIEYDTYLNKFKEKICKQFNYDDLYSIISPCKVKYPNYSQFKKLFYKNDKTFQV